MRRALHDARCPLLLLAAVLLAAFAAPNARADVSADRLRQAVSLARQSAWDEAIATLPPTGSLSRSHLALLWDAAAALNQERPTAAAHLLAAMRRLDPDAARPRIALETLWSRNPMPMELDTRDLPYFPVDAEETVLPASTTLPRTAVFTITPKPFVKVAAAVEPRHGYTFPYLVTVYTGVSDTLSLRCVVRSVGFADLPLDRQAGRFLAALSTLSDRMLGPVSRARYPVPVWIWPGGRPGAEEWANNILIHRTDLPRSPLEWVREAAHEWGHAALPGIDGFADPEPWANGDLGERLFLPAMARAGWLDAWQSGIDVSPYQQRYIDTLIEGFARTGPRTDMLTDTGRRGYDHFLGACLYIESAYGLESLVAALGDLDGIAPRELLLAFRRTLEGRSRWTVRRPDTSTGPRPICIPIAGQYILEGSAVGVRGRLLESAQPQPFPAGWVMVEWTGTLTVRQASGPAGKAPGRGGAG